jgi:hypothetical protein
LPDALVARGPLIDDPNRFVTLNVHLRPIGKYGRLRAGRWGGA